MRRLYHKSGQRALEEMRLPLVPMEESKKAVLRKTLQEYGLLTPGQTGG